MSEEELSPCPFCGGEAEIIVGAHHFRDAKVYCPRCSSEGAVCDADDGEPEELERNEDAAIAAWNRRAVPDGWRPIAEAPRDGTRVILFRENWEESRLVGYWHSDFLDWMVPGSGVAVVSATHWQPLPSPPRQPTEEAP